MIDAKLFKSEKNREQVIQVQLSELLIYQVRQKQEKSNHQTDTIRGAHNLTIHKKKKQTILEGNNEVTELYFPNRLSVNDISETLTTRN